MNNKTTYYQRNKETILNKAKKCYKNNKEILTQKAKTIYRELCNEVKM